MIIVTSRLRVLTLDRVGPILGECLVSPIEPLTPPCQCQYVCVMQYTHPQVQPSYLA